MTNVLEIPASALAVFHAAPGGVVTTRDLGRVGHHRFEVASWAAAGLTKRLLHGAYRLAEAPVPPDQCLHLPLRYLGQRTPRDFRTPAITGVGGLAAYDCGPFELPVHPLVLVDPRCRVRRSELPFSVRRTASDDGEDRVAMAVRVAEPARALADAALLRDVPDEALRQAIDDVRNVRLTTSWEIARRLPEVNHAGSRRLLAMVADGVLDQESDGERLAYNRLFVDHPPVPDCQVVVLRSFRVDFVYVSAGLVVEYYGRDAHRDRVERDATRVMALEQSGYRVIVVTHSMLRDAAGLSHHIHSIRRQREQQIHHGEIRIPPLPLQPPRLTPLRTLHPFG